MHGLAKHISCLDSLLYIPGMLHGTNQGADMEVPCTGMADDGSNEYEGDPDQTRPAQTGPDPYPSH
jgi:hypothetical protein